MPASGSVQEPKECQSTAPSASVVQRRVLFVTLEYKAGTFSGNGIYSQSMVRSLSLLGHSVFVLSARPNSSELGELSSRKSVESDLLEIPVEVWGRLDWNCGWTEFAAAITQEVAQKVAAFRPQWALIVDWSALEAYKALTSHRAAWEEADCFPPKMTYLNYRVYTLSEYKGDRAAEEKQFYREKEGEAVKSSWAIAALSTRDANFLQSEWGKDRMPGAPQARALLPPLREDIREWALVKKRADEDMGPDDSSTTLVPGVGMQELAKNWASGRRFLSCCVRLSPEKNADLFAAIVDLLAPTLKELGIVPLLCAGANSGDAYATSIKARVAKASPDALIIEGFLGPEKMGELYSQTLLNIHPCLYDAYGMTMVEAAAFGAPSVVNVGRGGAVGATELLDPAQGYSFALDLSEDLAEVSRSLIVLLKDTVKLCAAGRAAAGKSLSWSEEANARELTCIAEGTV